MSQSNSNQATGSQESRIQLAIAAIDDGSVPSLREASRVFSVPRSTLQARYHGRRSAQESQQSQQRLSVQEENSIKRTIQQMSAWGWPTTIRFLERLVTDLLQKKGDTKPLGQNWYRSYLARHPDLKLKPTISLDQARKDASDIETLEGWFNLYKDICAQYGILVEHQYNMDEKGFMRGAGLNSKVIIPVEEEDAWSIQPGDREWISVIEVIGTGGFIPPPFVIFGGQSIQHSWISPSIDSRTVINVSSSGWSDRSIALQWIKHFDKYTRPQTAGQYRLLILDGHTSHTSIELAEFCESEKIVPLCLPPHSTHILQPLDVGMFSPLSNAYKKEVSDHTLFGGQSISNRQFLQFFQKARQATFTAQNIASAWQKAGLLPFNPTPILERYRPKTPPFSTDKSSTNDNTAKKVDKIFSEVLQKAPPELHSPLKRAKEISLSAIADRSVLQFVNNSLIEKQKKGRKDRTRKNFGDAKVLSVKEAQKKIAERESREEKEKEEKERRAILKGKVGFAKLVWKEFKMDCNVFT